MSTKPIIQFDIITLFPEMFDGPFDYSIIKRAKDKGLVQINMHNLRKWAKGKYKKVDDTPYAGGGGMVMMIEPVADALKELKTSDAKVIAMTAKGEPLKQSLIKSLLPEPVNIKDKTKNSKPITKLIILCGHYEGFDQRILDNLVDIKISIGNFVLTGGEIPAMALVDAITRLLPEAVGNEATPKNDSFYEDDKSIQYPIYTKPAEFEYGGKILKVPQVLLSGNHKEITKWRKANTK